ncbi:MAG: AzlC family ABC transporter permease [Clostridia bacterium]|nr:AzlC family ABC transporter permease [Clostridia bacterium]
MKLYLKGLKAGIPIGLGYLSVSFTFGIMAISLGFSWWQAVIISAFTLTSAGQLAGIQVMVNPGQYFTMLISQLTINMRYSFMSVSLSQKVSPKFKGIKRWLLGFFMTDEIFAVASCENVVEPIFFLGLSTLPWIGWTLGTLLGALIGNVLPPVIMASLCIAIYGMFLAIIIPPAKKSKPILIVIIVAALLHCAFYYLPLLREIPSGISISISAILAAVFGALLFPINVDKEETGNA